MSNNNELTSLNWDTDYIGFTFQPIIKGVPQTAVHSTELNLYRVSDGSRYAEDFIPQMSDLTTEVPGGDGSYWWKSNYSQREFSIDVAFDSMTENNRRQISQLFNGKNLGYLVFDEMPFKRYTVKPGGPVNFKYISFLDEESNPPKRVYKGEGTLQFTAYYPFARSIYKFLNQYTKSLTPIAYNNKKLWSDASGMLSAQGTYDQVGVKSSTLYNAGDIETDIRIIYKFSSNKISLTALQLKTSTSDISSLQFANSITKISGSTDTYVCINSKSHLVEGMTLKSGGSVKKEEDFIRTGTLYNSQITSGDFFNIVTGSSTLTSTGGALPAAIFYDYIYF